MSKNGRAIIVVDVQKDFCEGGSLPVTGGREVASRIVRMLSWADKSIPVLATKDYHVNPGAHFSEHPDFKDSWPSHCVVGTPGVAFQSPISAEMFQDVFYKGVNSAAYSGFEGSAYNGDPTELLGPRISLDEWLKKNSVSSLFVCGIATDYCVKATVMDALNLGYDVTLDSALCAGVAPESSEQALSEMRKAGAVMHR